MESVIRLVLHFVHQALEGSREPYGWQWVLHRVEYGIFALAVEAEKGDTLHPAAVTWSTLCSSDSLVLLAPISSPACRVAMTVSTRALQVVASRAGPRLRLTARKKSFLHSQSSDLVGSVSRRSLAGRCGLIL